MGKSVKIRKENEEKEETWLPQKMESKRSMGLISFIESIVAWSGMVFGIICWL